MKNLLATLVAITLTLGLVACSEGDNGPSLPTLPDQALSAGFVVTVAPGPVDCRLKFSGTASGGSPGYAYKWDFGALTGGRVSQRIGTDADAVVEMVTTSTLVGAATYGITLQVTDTKLQTARASGFVPFSCAPGSPSTTFTF